MRSFIALLFIAFAAGADDRIDRAVTATRAMLDEHEIVRRLAQLVVVASNMKMCDGELAAFVARLSDGRLVVIPWSTDCATLKKTYRGIIPPNAIAIVHTHPDARPLPSEQDLAEARRIRIPICVLTRRGIWMAHPRDREPHVLLENPAWTVR